MPGIWISARYSPRPSSKRRSSTRRTEAPTPWVGGCSSDTPGKIGTHIDWTTAPGAIATISYIVYDLRRLEESSVQAAEIFAGGSGYLLDERRKGGKNRHPRAQRADAGANRHGAAQRHCREPLEVGRAPAGAAVVQRIWRFPDAIAGSLQTARG